MTEIEEALRDLIAILESPHTSVNVRWECGDQYKVALARCKKMLTPHTPDEDLHDFMDKANHRGGDKSKS